MEIKLDTRSERAEKTHKLAKELGCLDNDESMLLNCLRKISAKELHDVSVSSQYLPIFCPTIGDDFLPVSLTELYDAHKIHSGVDYITGITSEEGGYLMLIKPQSPDEMTSVVQKGISSDDPWVPFTLSQIAAMILMIPPGSVADNVSKLIKNVYLQDNGDNFDNLRGLLNAWADSFFIASTVGGADKIAEAGNTVYMYRFDQTPDKPLNTNVLQLHLVAAPEMDYGAIHGFDVFYMFGHSLLEDVPMSSADTMAEADKAVAASMVHAWSTFAKTG